VFRNTISVHDELGCSCEKAILGVDEIANRWHHPSTRCFTNDAADFDAPARLGDNGGKEQSTFGPVGGDYRQSRAKPRMAGVLAVARSAKLDSACRFPFINLIEMLESRA
jgi:hypothetical protein